MKEADNMTAKEMKRLADWLISHGHDAEEVLDCIGYIAQDKVPAPKKTEEKK